MPHPLEARAGEAGPLSLGAHQPFDFMQAAGNALGQDIALDTPGAIGTGAGNEAGAHFRADRFVVLGTLAWGAFQPRIEPGTRDAQRFAQHATRQTGGCFAMKPNFCWFLNSPPATSL